jgi:hypothetical protein
MRSVCIRYAAKVTRKRRIILPRKHISPTLPHAKKLQHVSPRGVVDSKTYAYIHKQFKYTFRFKKTIKAATQKARLKGRTLLRRRRTNLASRSCKKQTRAALLRARAAFFMPLPKSTYADNRKIIRGSKFAICGIPSKKYTVSPLKHYGGRHHRTAERRRLH